MGTVPLGFQPAGRAPAPPPLDLVQDFVNTEIAVWAVDDIATPELLAEWLQARGLVSSDATVDASSFVRARALRDVLRELAKRNTRGAEPDDALRAQFASLAAETPLRFGLSERGDVMLDAGRRRRERRVRRDPLARVRGAGVRRLEAAQVVSRPALRLAVLRRIAKRFVDVVLDVDLREPDEDGRLPEASQGRALRSITFVAGLAWKRLRRRDSGAAVAVLGLAVATAVLAGVLAGVTIATDRSVALAIERIPTSERSVRAVWFVIPGDPSERLAALDREVDDAFAGIGLDGPTPIVLFREGTVAGEFVGITAIEGVPDHVILRSGRMPRTCTTARCEVLRLRGRGTLPNAPGLRLVQVGTGTLRSRQLFGDFLLDNDAAVPDATVPPELGETSEYHRPPPPPLVVAEGRSALEASPLLARTYRTYAWVWPVDPGAPRLWDVDRLVARTERAHVELTERSSSFAVDAPVEELREAERSADVAGTRLLLVGGEGAALLLAFTILAARGMRRDLEATRRRLRWFGAQRWQLALLGGIESSAVALVGVALGWIAGVVVAGIVAGLSGAPVGDVLRESVVSPTGLGLAVATALLAAALVWITVSLPSREGARVGVLDVVAGAALLVIAVALLGGAADEDQLARGEGTALLLLVLPGLIAIAAASPRGEDLPCARAFRSRSRTREAAFPTRRDRPRTRAGRRARNRRVPDDRLRRGAARGGIPRDARARRPRAGCVPGPARHRRPRRPPEPGACLRRGADRAVRGARRHRRRRSARVARHGRRGKGRAGRRGHRAGARPRRRSRTSAIWRNDWASGRDPADLAALVAPDGGADMRGVPLPDGRLAFEVGPGLVSLAAIVRSGDGSFRRVELGEAKARTSSLLRARVAPGALLTAVEVVPPPRLIERGADAGVAFFATTRLSGPLAVRLRDWIGVGGSVVQRTSNGVSVRVPLTLQRTSGLRAAQPTDEAPPPVLVTPRLAELAGGVGEVIPLQIGGGSVPVQVAGTVERFPGTSDETVVGDRIALRTAINAAAPGARARTRCGSTSSRSGSPR